MERQQERSEIKLAHSFRCGIVELRSSVIYHDHTSSRPCFHVLCAKDADGQATPATLLPQPACVQPARTTLQAPLPTAASMRLIVITPEILHPGEPAAARQMMQRGLTTLHLRKPSATRQQLAQYLTELGDPWTRRVMLHTHHDLARDFRVKVRCVGCGRESRDGWSECLGNRF